MLTIEVPLVLDEIRLPNLHPALAARSSFRADRAAEAVLQKNAVARRQHARRLVGADRDPGEQRGRRVGEAGGKLAQPELVADVERLLEAAGLRDADQIDASAVWLACMPVSP